VGSKFDLLNAISKSFYLTITNEFLKKDTLFLVDVIDSIAIKFLDALRNS
jgi:hypothetical protein